MSNSLVTQSSDLTTYIRSIFTYMVTVNSFNATVTSMLVHHGNLPMSQCLASFGLLLQRLLS